MSSSTGRRCVRWLLTTFAVTAFALAFVGGVTANPKPKPHAKIFDKGCWKGKGVFEYTSIENGATVTFHKGKVTFTLHVTKNGTATGFMDVTAHGIAEVPAVNGEGEVNITGSFDLTGKAAHVKADGSYHIAGTIISSGFEVPMAWDVDASGPLTIKKATKTTAAGAWGDQIDWTAKRVGASCI
jgi:hypothetical protein